jgi:phosphosulfolactate synthase
MPGHIFDGLDGRSRSNKPRTTGQTMVVDWGMGPHAQLDMLVTGADYADFAKVAVGISRLLSNDVLVDKVRTYKNYGVEPFPGGQYLEYAEVEGKADHYIPAVRDAGYSWIEVSDNLGAVSLEWKLEMISEGRRNELRVFGEVGKKEGLGSSVSMVDDAAACLDAGSDIILLEAAELIDDDADTAAAVEAVVEKIGLNRVMFELPGPWIEGVSTALIHHMRRQLVDRYGPDVNVGNVDPTEVISFEAYRRGLGVNAGKAED